MAVTSKLFGLALSSMASGTVNFSSGTVKAMLCTASYSPNQDTHQFKSDVTNEVTGTGYTAGGQTLTSKSINYSSATNKTTLTAADPSWTGSTITARYVVFYVDTGVAGTSPLISWADFGENITTSAATLTVELASTGLATFTAA